MYKKKQNKTNFDPLKVYSLFTFDDNHHQHPISLRQYVSDDVTSYWNWKRNSFKLMKKKQQQHCLNDKV